MHRLRRRLTSQGLPSDASRDHAVFVRDPERARKLASHSAIERLASAELCGNRRELTDGAAQMAHRRGESDARMLRNLDADIT